jgi:hypothetical protein
LRVVGAYSEAQFTTLMRTGEAVGGRTLQTMSPYAKRNLSQLTDPEVAALYAYLKEGLSR